MTDEKLQNIEGYDKGIFTTYHRSGTISLINKALACSLMFSLITSTVLSVPSLHDFNNDSDTAPVATFKPIINGLYSSADWYLNVDGSVYGGNGQRIEQHNQPKLLREALNHGADAVRALLSQSHVYVKNDQLTLTLPLMGGMKGSGNRLVVEVRPLSTKSFPTPDPWGPMGPYYGASPVLQILLFQQEQQVLAALSNTLTNTLNYHVGNGSPQYSSLSVDEKNQIIAQAQNSCSKDGKTPDTEVLKEAIKDVVYSQPANNVLGWYKDHPSPGVQYFKNLNAENSHRIIETAKELAYNHGGKPDSHTISKAYDSVMSSELKYVFEYHKEHNQPAYQNRHPEIEREILTRAIGNMKISPDEFKNPDTGPLAAVLRHSEQLGSALLRGYGQTINTVLCELFGVCEAKAVGPLVLGAPLLGEALAATTVGISAQYLWDHGVKSDLTEIVNWLHTSITFGIAGPKINSTPMLDEVKLKILETWGGDDTMRILSTSAELDKVIKLEMDEYDGQKITILNQDYYGAPKVLPAFPDAVKAPAKTHIKGVGQRKRWKDPDHIYEWDSRHGKVEKYSKNGKKHLGEFDSNTGEQTKPADPSRRVEK